MPETILHFKGGKKRFLLSPNHLLCRFYCLHVGYFTVQKKKRGENERKSHFKARDSFEDSSEDRCDF